MKVRTIFLLVLLVSCGKSGSHDGHDENGTADSVDTNRALYDQVMEIHDEVMPKMQDIYNLKKDIQDQITNTPGMVKEQKEEFQRMITKLDSAERSMMDWMHQFNLPDSLDNESKREYLETEMEKIRKVRDLTNEALKEASAVSLRK